ncbi:MAG: hypothetical protein M1838_003902, partial [Thelocarpon superellum]
MASSDLNVLLDMGFDQERAEQAVKKSGGLQGALEWLESMQDKSMDEIKESAAHNENDPTAEPPDLKPGEQARSLICNECGKRFRSQAQAEFHASKTEHVDFAESTEEIAPLTEEEKKEKLEQLKRKLAEKREGQSSVEKEEQKRNEVCHITLRDTIPALTTAQAIRRKSTKETQDLKEDLQKKEQMKIAAAKRREKQEELAAKERIRMKIKADQEERRLKAQKEKAERDGLAPPPVPAAATPAPTASSPAQSKPGSEYSQSRLRLQTPHGEIRKSFAVDTTLFEVAAAVHAENGMQVESFTQTFPRKTFTHIDFGQSLRESGLFPSAVLM